MFEWAVQHHTCHMVAWYLWANMWSIHGVSCMKGAWVLPLVTMEMDCSGCQVLSRVTLIKLGHGGRLALVLTFVPMDV